VGLTSAFDSVLAVWRKRLQKNFSTSALELLQFLNPAVDQLTWTRERRAAAMSLLLAHMSQYYHRRHEVFSDEAVQADVGEFLARTGDFPKDYRRYWMTRFVSTPVLARFAVSLSNLSITEAAVERSFKKEARVFNKYRASLSEVTVQALLMIAINYPKTMQPERGAKAAVKAEKVREQRQRKAQGTLDDLVAKHMKHEPP